MSDRVDYFYLQLVSATELDQLGEDLEVADRAFAVDHMLARTPLTADLIPTRNNGGIVASSLAALPAPGVLTYPVKATTAYDAIGRRMRVSGDTTVDLSQTGDCVIGGGGVPTGPGSFSTAVAAVPAGQERWISVFLRSERKLSDPRTDGAGATVFFERDESFVIVVTAGAEAAAGTGVLVGVDAVPDAVLLFDVKRTTAGLSDLNAHSGGNRRQDWFVRDSTLAASLPAPVDPFPKRRVRRGNARDVLSDLLTFYNLHVRDDADTGDQHRARQIEYEGGPTWIDGTTNPAKLPGPAASPTAGVEGQLDKIISDLINTVTPNSGAEKVGAGSHLTAPRGATRPTGIPDTGTIPGVAATLALGALDAQVTALLLQVNRMIRIDAGADGAAEEIHGSLIPDQNGAATPHLHTLGSVAKKWAALNAISGNVDLLSVASTVQTNLVPAGAGQALGSAGARWDMFAETLTAYAAAAFRGSVDFHAAGGGVGNRVISDVLPDTSGVRLLGVATLRWNAFLGPLDVETPTTNAASTHSAKFTARQANATTGEAGRFVGKTGAQVYSVNDVGVSISKRSVFRDDLMYKSSAAVETLFWTVDQDAGAGGGLVALESVGGLGGVRLVTDTVDNNDKRLRLTAAVLSLNATAGFVARVDVPTGDSTSRSDRFGFTTAAGATLEIVRDTDEGVNPNNWRLKSTAGPTNIDLGDSTTGLRVFELRILDGAGTVEVLIDGARPPGMSAPVVIAGLALFDSFRFQVHTRAVAAAKTLRIGFVQIYRIE